MSLRYLLSRASVRALAMANTLLSLAASFVFSIAVTRKLPFIYLGLLNIYAGAISISTVATSIVSFMSPRLSARDGGLAAGLVMSSLIIGLVGSAIAAAFMFGIRWRVTEYFGIITALAVVSATLTSIGYAFGGALTVFNRSRLMYSSIITSAVKLASVYYIYLERWSFESVLIANFVILMSGAVYSALAAAGLLRPGELRKSFKEIMAGAWVALVGYASGNVRSLDSFMIAGFGGVEDNAAWQVLGVAGGIYSFRGQLMSITYGEMLQGMSSERRAYYDLLLMLFFTASASLLMIFFEPEVMAFLRPTDPYLIGLMWIPFTIWASSNVFSTFNRYLATVMQGAERRDLKGNLTARTYVGSLVLYANLAELILTVSYIALIPVLVLSLERLSVYFYVLDGVILAGAVATAIAVAAQIISFPQAKKYLDPGALMVDFLAPLIVSSAVLYLARPELESMFPPTVSALLGLIRLAILGIITALIYLAASVAISSNSRKIASAVINRAIKRAKALL